jgi:LysM repeat protein
VGIPVTGGTAGTGRAYTVQEGDTLSAIAAANNTTVNTLLSTNTWITNPDLIFPGQVVDLP